MATAFTISSEGLDLPPGWHPPCLEFGGMTWNLVSDAPMQRHGETVVLYMSGDDRLYVVIEE